MRISALILAAVVFLTASAPGGLAAAGRAESQEQCHALAAQYFAREYGETTSRNDYVDPDTHKVLSDVTRAGFSAYYQPRQGKCVVVTSIENETRLNDAKNASIWLIAIELNGHRSPGLFHQTNGDSDVCFMGARDCHSRADWDSLLKSYLEE